MVTVNLSAVLAALPENPRIVATGNHVTPWHALGLVDEALPEYRLWVLNAQPGVPQRDGVTHETAFVGPGVRRSPWLSYTPCRLSMVPSLFRRQTPPDAVLLHTTRPRNGEVSMGTEVNILPAAIEQVRRRGGKVVAQVNDRMPWTTGDALVPESFVDVMVEADGDLPTAPVGAIDDESALIGSMVAERVPDGATLQAGIGAVPGRRPAWTGDPARPAGLDRDVQRQRAGARARGCPGPRRSALRLLHLRLAGAAWPGSTTTSRIEMVRTEVTNDPARIARNPQMVQRQHRPPDRPVRPGQRLPDQRPDPLRVRRADRLHRRCPAQRRWPGDDGAEVVAPEGGLLHDRPPGRRAGDLVPADRGGHRAGRGRGVRLRPAGAGPAPDPRRRPPAGARRALGGGRGARSGPEPSRLGAGL